MQRCRTCCRADKYTVDDAQKIARDYRNQVGASKRSVSEYDGKPEPSATTDVSGKRKSADAAAAAIGKKFDQKSVLRFRRGVVGQQPEYTLTGVKDPVAALRVLKEHGIEGARVEDGKLIFVDESKKLGGNLKSAANELGAKLSKRRGYAKLITNQEYDGILQAYEQQQSLINKGPRLNPLYLAGVGTSYGAQPNANRRQNVR